MRIGRTLPPVAIPLTWAEIGNGLAGWTRGLQEIERFRRELSSYFEGRHCFLVSSGKAALYLVLEALKALHPGRNEVLIPAFTCYSVPSAIVRAGLTIRTCDVDPESLDFDRHELGLLLKNGPDGAWNPASRLLAVVPTHLFGLAADVADLRSRIHDPAVTIIEDAAQTFGARNSAGLLGCGGDVGIFSLGRGKALSTVSGGVIVTAQARLAQAIAAVVERLPAAGALVQARLLAYAAALRLLLPPSRFWLPRALSSLRLGATIYDPDFPVGPFTPFQAGLARGWKRRLVKLHSIRHAQAKDWRRRLASQMIHPLPKENTEENLIRYPVRVPPEARAALLAKADQAGLGVMPGYPGSVADIPELNGQLRGKDCPQAKRLARELITLPVHPFVTDSDRDKTVHLLSACIGRRQPDSMGGER